jgi:hypothetical protein
MSSDWGGDQEVIRGVVDRQVTTWNCRGFRVLHQRGLPLRST